jgi:hypothetical protein
MMRTIEILFVIVIMMGAFITASLFAVLPGPSQVSPLNLSRLSLTTLEMLNTNYNLSGTVFKPLNDPSWNQLQVALSASLPPNIVYNLTVYQVQTGGTQLYTPIKSISDAQSLGIGSDSSTYLVSSSNVTFSVTPQKIGSYGMGGTLYILNCSDANGWWITGYTVQGIAGELYNLLSPYFQRTVMVQNTTQLGKILNGTSLQGETLKNAVVINTCGEAVPIPAGYYTAKGYDSKDGSFANYTYTLGLRVNAYNWTWVSIVGYPFYYVTNTNTFKNYQNTWGIYGMQITGNKSDEGSSGLNAFLEGLAGQAYSYNPNWIAQPGGSQYIVNFTSSSSYYSNYYGIYPSPYQTATRALPKSVLSTYGLSVLPNSYIFNVVNNTWIAGATYNHEGSDGKIHGSFMAIGLARIPDVRIVALGLLSYYEPTLYKSAFTASGTSRLIVLQLGEVGGG